jgi:transcriptional regulator with XRE-family HTH domain
METVKGTSLFGAVLREKRKAKEWSQDTLVERSGHVCSKSFISQLETNKYVSDSGEPMRPNVEIVNALAEALGESKNEFRRLAGHPPLDSEISADEATMRFTYALHNFKRLSQKGQEFAERHINETIDFAIAMENPDNTEPGFFIDNTGGKNEEVLPNGQTIRYYPIADLPSATLEEVKGISREKSKKPKSE